MHIIIRKTVTGQNSCHFKNSQWIETLKPRAFLKWPIKKGAWGDNLLNSSYRYTQKDDLPHGHPTKFEKTYVNVEA